MITQPSGKKTYYRNKLKSILVTDACSTTTSNSDANPFPACSDIFTDQSENAISNRLNIKKGLENAEKRANSKRSFDLHGWDRSRDYVANENPETESGVIPDKKKSCSRSFKEKSGKNPMELIDFESFEKVFLQGHLVDREYLRGYVMGKLADNGVSIDLSNSVENNLDRMTQWLTKLQIDCSSNIIQISPKQVEMFRKVFTSTRWPTRSMSFNIVREPDEDESDGNLTSTESIKKSVSREVTTPSPTPSFDSTSCTSELLKLNINSTLKSGNAVDGIGFHTNGGRRRTNTLPAEINSIFPEINHNNEPRTGSISLRLELMTNFPPRVSLAGDRDLCESPFESELPTPAMFAGSSCSSDSSSRFSPLPIGKVPVRPRSRRNSMDINRRRRSSNLSSSASMDSLDDRGLSPRVSITDLDNPSKYLEELGNLQPSEEAQELSDKLLSLHFDRTGGGLGGMTVEGMLRKSPDTTPFGILEYAYTQRETAIQEDDVADDDSDTKTVVDDGGLPESGQSEASSYGVAHPREEFHEDSPSNSLYGAIPETKPHVVPGLQQQQQLLQQQPAIPMKSLMEPHNPSLISPVAQRSSLVVPVGAMPQTPPLSSVGLSFPRSSLPLHNSFLKSGFPSERIHAFPVCSTSFSPNASTFLVESGVGFAPPPTNSDKLNERKRLSCEGDDRRGMGPAVKRTASCPIPCPETPVVPSRVSLSQHTPTTFKTPVRACLSSYDWGCSAAADASLISQLMNVAAHVESVDTSEAVTIDTPEDMSDQFRTIRAASDEAPHTSGNHREHTRSVKTKPRENRATQISRSQSLIEIGSRGFFKLGREYGSTRLANFLSPNSKDSDRSSTDSVFLGQSTEISRNNEQDTSNTSTSSWNITKLGRARSIFSAGSPKGKSPTSPIGTCTGTSPVDFDKNLGFRGMLSSWYRSSSSTSPSLNLHRNLKLGNKESVANSSMQISPAHSNMLNEKMQSKKGRVSAMKWRRISVCLNNKGLMQLPFSPLFMHQSSSSSLLLLSDSKKKKNYRRRSDKFTCADVLRGIHSEDSNSLSEEETPEISNESPVLNLTLDHAFHAQVTSPQDGVLSHRQRDLSGLDGLTFAGVVIGGTYQQWWDGEFPVISPPTSCCKRVVGLHIHDHNGCCELDLYLPKDKITKKINLGTDWVWIPASPEGFLISKGPFVPMKRLSSNKLDSDYRRTCYFLSKHPLEWVKPLNRHQENERSCSSMSILAIRTGPLTSENSSDSIGSIPSRTLLHLNGSNNEVSVADTSPIQNDALGSLSPVARASVPRQGRRLSSVHESNLSPFTNEGTMNVDDPRGRQHHHQQHQQQEQYHHQQQAEDVMEINGESVLVESEILGNDSFSDMNDASSTSYISVDQSQLDNTIIDEDIHLDELTSKLDWAYNSVVISHVIEFLFDYDESEQQIYKSNRNKIITQKLETLHLRNNSEHEIRSPTFLVCKSWSLESYKLLAKQLSHEKPTSLAYPAYRRFMTRYNWGKFICKGACKEVYCVQNYASRLNYSSHGRNVYDAVSVMDVKDLEARSMDSAVACDLEISMICSTLGKLNICPNLVQIYSIFRTAFAIPDGLWTGERSLPSPLNDHIVPIPSAANFQKGCYQYMRMEYCNGGDLEEYLRKNTLDSNSLKYLFFQMCYVLYCCREQLLLRHYDIKLLNMLVTTANSTLSNITHPHPIDTLAKNTEEIPKLASSTTNEMDPDLSIHYGFGEYVFAVPVSLQRQSVLKLTDFGTSVIGERLLGTPITVQQFTTLENTPPEFLILGSACRQSYAADTFCIGLSFFHLLTGDAPYEEILQQVFCPPFLAEKLSLIWEANDSSSPYEVIKECLRTLDTDSEAENSSSEQSQDKFNGKCSIFCDTLYRYLVLFGIPEDLGYESNDPWLENPIWMTILDSLTTTTTPDLKSNLDTQTNSDSFKIINHARQLRTRNQLRNLGSKSKVKKQDCILQFVRDTQMWSIQFGSHEIISRARQNLVAICNHSSESESLQIIRKMTHLNPARRCSLHELVLSPIFISLRIDPSSKSEENQTHISFLHYFRCPVEGGANVIPIV